MTRSAPDIESFCRDPRPALFAFDYDGTLTPIVDRPEDARAPAEVGAALDRIARRPATFVALVSGRSVASIHEVAPHLDGHWRIGQHGLETAAPHEAPALSPGLDADALEKSFSQLVERTQAIVAAHPKARLENKGHALALHSRALSEDEEMDVQAAFRAASGGLAQVTVIVGKRVIEARPAGVDKGKALATLHARLCPDARPVYVGDDTTDEDAFAALADSEGALTVKVSTDPDVLTKARFQVPDVAAVHALIAAIEAHRPA